jgi:hypothetical protein
MVISQLLNFGRWMQLRGKGLNWAEFIFAWEVFF